MRINTHTLLLPLILSATTCFSADTQLQLTTLPRDIIEHKIMPYFNEVEHNRCRLICKTFSAWIVVTKDEIKLDLNTVADEQGQYHLQDAKSQGLLGMLSLNK